jgi:hypothetical protein
MAKARKGRTPCSLQHGRLIPPNGELLFGNYLQQGNLSFLNVPIAVAVTAGIAGTKEIVHNETVERRELKVSS